LPAAKTEHGLAGGEDRFDLFEVRPAVDALQQHHVDLLQQLGNGIADLDAHAAELLGELLHPIGAGRDVRASAGKAGHHLHVGQVALGVGIVQ